MDIEHPNVRAFPPPAILNHLCFVANEICWIMHSIVTKRHLVSQRSTATELYVVPDVFPKGFSSGRTHPNRYHSGLIVLPPNTP